MGKKIAFLMCLAMLCAALIFVVGCGGGGGDDAKWEKDETHHWKTEDAKEEHTFGDWNTTVAAVCTTPGEKTRTCTVCKYVEVAVIDAPGHTYKSTWSYDEDYHWREATCIHTDEIGDYGYHTYEGGRCTACRQEQPVTSGIIYEKISNTSAKIVGVEPGVKLSGSVVLAAYFEKSYCKVTEISPNAFVGQTGITSINLPDSLKTIGEGAFDGCSQLTSIVIGGEVTKFGDYVFRNCASLSNVTLGAKMTAVPAHTFDGCVSLTAITIPAKVTEIGAYAFNGCTKLESVTYNTTALATIGARAFGDCVALENVTIPTTVTKIGGSAYTNTAFANKAANRENGVLYCGNYLLNVAVDVEGEVVVKSTTTLIADRAFENCALVTSVNKPATTAVGANVYVGCDKMIETGLIVMVGDFTFEKVDGAYQLISYGGTAAEVVLPANAESNTYTIAPHAFAGNRTITSVTISEGVTAIGAYAFSGCAKLTTVRMGSAVTSVGENAFIFCSVLDNVYATDIAAWCAIDFANREAHPFNYFDENTTNKFYLNDAEVTALTIPAGVEIIGDWAFYNCERITSLTIGADVKGIGVGAFRTYLNGGLTSVTCTTTGWKRGKTMFGTGIDVTITAAELKGNEAYAYYIPQ